MSPEQTVFVLVHWTTPDKEDTQIRCEKLCGTVAYGKLVLKGEEVA